jgi:hypothetical protein
MTSTCVSADVVLIECKIFELHMFLLSPTLHCSLRSHDSDLEGSEVRMCVVLCWRHDECSCVFVGIWAKRVFAITEGDVIANGNGTAFQLGKSGI